MRKGLEKPAIVSPASLLHALLYCSVSQRRNSSSVNRSHLINPLENIQYERPALLGSQPHRWDTGLSAPKLSLPVSTPLPGFSLIAPDKRIFLGTGKFNSLAQFSSPTPTLQALRSSGGARWTLSRLFWGMQGGPSHLVGSREGRQSDSQGGDPESLRTGRVRLGSLRKAHPALP